MSAPMSAVDLQGEITKAIQSKRVTLDSVKHLFGLRGWRRAIDVPEDQRLALLRSLLSFGEESTP